MTEAIQELKELQGTSPSSAKSDDVNLPSWERLASSLAGERVW